MIKRIIAAAVLLTGAGTASATTVYTYTGQNFTSVTDQSSVPGAYTSSDRITGWFEVASPLNGGPLDLEDYLVAASFSDGRNTLTLSDVKSFYVGTDTSGNIVTWDIALATDWMPDLGEPYYLIRATTYDGFEYGQTAGCSTPLCDGFYAFDEGRTSSLGEWAAETADASPVPLPATGVLLIAALGGMGCVNWRRKRKTAVT